MPSRLIFNQSGDTIVEVLLAIAIVSAVLGAAYVSVDRSLRGSRQAQERGEAMKLLEGQVERLKELSAVPGSGIFTAVGSFCIDNSSVVVNATNAACRQGTENRYRLSIERNGNLFTTHAVWDKAGGGGQDRVQFRYRIYQQ